MANAGKAIADFLAARFPDRHYLFVCGTGNNGGDGFAAAGILCKDHECTVALLKEPCMIRSKEASERFESLKSQAECEIVRYSGELLDREDIVIVDCALGTGLTGAVKEPYLSFINDANASGRTIVSVDIPSGFGTGTRIIPAATITFHDLKEGMTAADCGDIFVSDIGIPEEASRVLGPGDMLRYPVPRKESHKGDNGRLLVIAGGPYFGAPALACRSAMRTGADLVHLCCPESVFPIVASSCPEITGTRLPGDRLTPESVETLLGISEKYDAVLIGPGLGSAADTMDAVREFVSACGKPLVIDADAIRAVASMEVGNAVLTPHRAEFAQLGDDMESVAKRYGAIVLKGGYDTISDGTRTRENRTGNPGMTCAGTGDVLAGCVAALLSKGMSCFDSGCLGTYIVGSAGDLAFEDRSYGLIATDVAERIPSVLREHLR